MVKKMKALDNDKVIEMLIQLMTDMSYVKAKLDNIDEQKLSSRIDQLEAFNAQHEKTIKSLEHRANTMEQFTRNNMNDSKKQMVSVYISLGMAIVSAVISLVFNMF